MVMLGFHADFLHFELRSAARFQLSAWIVISSFAVYDARMMRKQG
jgi:hypothetical protein